MVKNDLSALRRHLASGLDPCKKPLAYLGRHSKNPPCSGPGFLRDAIAKRKPGFDPWPPKLLVISATIDQITRQSSFYLEPFFGPWTHKGPGDISGLWPATRSTRVESECQERNQDGQEFLPHFRVKDLRGLLAEILRVFRTLACLVGSW